MMLCYESVPQGLARVRLDNSMTNYDADKRIKFTVILPERTK
jgi:hypothetical protein